MVKGVIIHCLRTQFLKFLSSKQESPEKSTVGDLTGRLMLKQELYLPARLQTSFCVPFTCLQQDLSLPLVSLICRFNSTNQSSSVFFRSSFITSSSSNSTLYSGCSRGEGIRTTTPVKNAYSPLLRCYSWGNDLIFFRDALRTAFWAFVMRVVSESGCGNCCWGQLRSGGVAVEERHSSSGVSISLRRRVMARFFCDKNCRFSSRRIQTGYQIYMPFIYNAICLEEVHYAGLQVMMSQYGQIIWTWLLFPFREFLRAQLAHISHSSA